MKDEFLNFTGPSWGEYSNASGRRGNGNGGDGSNVDYNSMFAEMFYNAQGCVYEGIDIIAPMISEFLSQQGITESNTPFSIEEVAYYYEGMYLMGPSCQEYNDPNPPAPPQQNEDGFPSCLEHLEAYQYLVNNSVGNTEESIVAYYDAIWTLLGGPNAFSPYGVPMVSSDSPNSQELQIAQLEQQIAMYQHEEDSCRTTFMSGECLYNYNLYDPEQVANTLASAITSYCNLLFGIYNGSVTIPNLNLSNVESLEILEGVYDIVNRIWRLEYDCGPARVPSVVEQALGNQMVELITVMWENGALVEFENYGYTLEQFICAGEFPIMDESLYTFWEVLNFTPTMCGGSGGDCPDCPECPDCGLSENCPDCDCPDPCPQGGGVTGGGGVVVTQGPTQFQNGGVKPTKPTKPIPKSRVPRVRKSRFNGLKL